MKRYVWAAILLLLCPVAKAQSDSAAVATDTTDVYKNVGLGELTVKAQRQMVKTKDDRKLFNDIKERNRQ